MPRPSRKTKASRKLNDMLKEARDDDAQKKYDDAATLMQQAVALKADVAILWLELGVAQTGQKKYADAATSLQKALDLDTASKKPNPEIEAAADNDLGEANAGLGKIPEATAAYDAAAKLVPANAASYYTNEAIVLSKTGNTDATVAAADKAIAADPTKPRALLPEGPGACRQSHRRPQDARCHRRRQDASKPIKSIWNWPPTVPYAAEVQQILAGIGAKVSTTYKAPKG